MHSFQLDKDGGVMQALNSDGKKLNNSTISKFVNSDKILSLQEMLNADREALDSIISTEVYKVSCGAFIDVLLIKKTVHCGCKIIY